MQPGTSLSVFCPACGQALTIPLHDLQARFPCPRCQTWHVVADFTDRSQPVAVAPVPPAAHGPPQPWTPPPHVAPPWPSAYAAPPAAVMSPPPGAFSALPPHSPAELGAAPQPTPSPASSATRSTPEALLAGSVQAAQMGVAAARQSTSWLLDVADWIDGKLAGRRVLVLGAASIVGVLLQSVGEQATLAWFSGVLFLVALAVMALAFVARCRDEDTGRFSAQLASERIAATVSLLSETLKDFSQSTPGLRLQYAGRSLAFLGFFAAEALILAVRFEALDPAPRSILAALWASGVGFVLWWWGAALERGGDRAALSSLATPGGRNAVDAVRCLPHAVDTKEEIQRTANPLVDGLLGLLKGWRPGERANEREYQVRLERFLQRHLPAVDVEAEVPVPHEYGRRRLDLVLESKDESLVVELKASFTTSECDRAATQVRTYTQLRRGPVVLVLCGASAESLPVRGLLANIEAMRAQGLPVVAVLATVRGRPMRLAELSTPPSVDPALQARSGPPRAAPAFALLGLAVVFGTMMVSPPQSLASQRQYSTDAAAITPTRSPDPGTAEAPSATANWCTARPSSSFHLRPYATLDSIGPQYPAGTSLIVHEFAGIVRRSSRLHRVQTPDGAVGFVFLAPNEFTSACGL